MNVLDFWCVSSWGGSFRDNVSALAVWPIAFGLSIFFTVAVMHVGCSWEGLNLCGSACVVAVFHWSVLCRVLFVESVDSFLPEHLFTFFDSSALFVALSYLPSFFAVVEGFSWVGFGSPHFWACSLLSSGF